MKNLFRIYATETGKTVSYSSIYEVAERMCDRMDKAGKHVATVVFDDSDRSEWLEFVRENQSRRHNPPAVKHKGPARKDKP